jgi:hypothetical protein
MPDFIKLTLDVAGGEYQADLYVKMYDVVRMVREDNRTTIFVNAGGGTEKSYYVRETPEEICEQHDAQYTVTEAEPPPKPEQSGITVSLYSMLDAILKRFPVNPAPRKIELSPNHYSTTLPVGKDHTLTLYGHADDFNALENIYLAESTGRPVPPEPTAANKGEANGS